MQNSISEQAKIAEQKNYTIQFIKEIKLHKNLNPNKYVKYSHQN